MKRHKKKELTSTLAYRTTFNKVIFWSVISILYAPIITLIVYSFNDSKRNIIWKGFTLKYYWKALNNTSLMEATLNSLIIASTNAIFSTILGFITAYSLWRFRFKFKPLYEGTLVLPIVIPDITLGVAFLAFFHYIQWPTDIPWPFSLSNIIVAHITFSFPFVSIMIRGRLENFNLELEEVGLDLRATRWQIIRDIILPFVRPALISSLVLAFTLSLDDFIITFFTAGMDTVTFPIKVYSMVRFSVTPEVNAISTIMIAITFLLVFIILFYQQQSLKRTNIKISKTHY